MSSKRNLDGESPSPENNIEALRKCYKRARKVYKSNKTDDALKQAKADAKKALEEAEAAAGYAPKEEEAAEMPTKREDDNDAPNTDESKSAPTDIKALEAVYHKALAAFKADKSDKDLRRAKTAARRAVDDAIASSEDGEQLVCRDCSKKFIFTRQEMVHDKRKGWSDLSKRCRTCIEAQKMRLCSVERRNKLDGGSRRMCYAFQRGECTHGDTCRFSHNPKHGGKRSKGGDSKGSGAAEKSGGTDGPKLLRKENSLRRKEKGWRNK